MKTLLLVDIWALNGGSEKPQSRAGLVLRGGAGTGHACLLLPKPQVPSLTFSSPHSLPSVYICLWAPEPRGKSCWGKAASSSVTTGTFRLLFAPGFRVKQSNSEVPPHQLPAVQGTVARSPELGLLASNNLACLPLGALSRTVLPPQTSTSLALLPSFWLFILSLQHTHTVSFCRPN